jgi:pantoate--beta-alanine ligase
VTTVVAKQFNIIRPQLAVFGEKDFQQLQIIRRMVRDLSYPIRILAVPTVREPDGLARSSRNELLSPEERAQATVLFKALNIAEDLFRAGERNAHRLSTAMIRAIQLAPMARVDYAEIADPDTFEPVSDVRAGHVILLAVWLGRTRLIDNRVL